MEDLELKNMWKNTEMQLENNILQIQKNTDDIARLTIRNNLSGMKPIKIFAIAVGVIWVLGLGGFLASLAMYHFAEVNKCFLFSATLQVLITAVATGMYLYQLILLQSVDYSEPIASTQQKLLQLQSSTLRVFRVLALQLPLWTTFYWNSGMLKNGHWALWIFQGLATLAFAALAVWLFRNVRLENSEKKWFQLIFNGKEWQPILRAMQYVNDLKSDASN